MGCEKGPDLDAGACVAYSCRHDAGVAMNDSAPTPVREAAPANGTEGVEQGGDGQSQPRGRQLWPYWTAVAVFVVGLVVTGVLVWVSASTYTRNENRLLSLRARDAGTLLTGALPNLQIPLASAAALADATDGDVGKFRSFIGPSVGPQGKGQFVSVSLWRLSKGQPQRLATVGVSPVLPSTPTRLTAFFANARQGGKLKVIGLLNSPQPRLGYAFTSPGLTGRYVAYAESALPANRHSDLYQCPYQYTTAHPHQHAD